MRKALALLLCLSLILSAAAALAEPAAGDAAALTYFWFTRGGYLPPESYEIVLADGAYTLTRDDGATAVLEPSTLEALMALLADYDLYAWDGFHESMSEVLDGEGFGLNVSFSDGTGIDASGDNAFPDGYFAAADAIRRLLDAALDGAIPGTYRYEGEGFGGDFTLTLSDDGSYTFYEGPLSSYMGGGHWFAERTLLYLTEENGFDLQFYFLFSDGALTYLADYSDPFPYVSVPDEGRFTRIESPEQAD